MGIGKLCLQPLQVKCSAASELHTFSRSAVLLGPYLCARETVAYVSTIESCSHHNLVKGALFSLSVRILEAQRCPAPCPSHTASEDQSRISLRCDSKPRALRNPPHQPRCHQKYPIQRGRMRCFLFLRHIGNSGQTSSHITLRVNFYS